MITINASKISFLGTLRKIRCLMNEDVNKLAQRTVSEDESLIREFHRRNESVFDQLVLKYKDRIFNACYRFLGNYDEANDMAQETFLKAYKGLKNFQFKSAFSTWLYTIALNTCRNRVNSSSYKKGKQNLSMDRMIENEEGSFKAELKGPALSPSEELTRKEFSQHLEEHLNALDEQHKCILILRDIDGLPYEEIGDILSLNLGTVKSRLSRARELLRNKLTKGSYLN